MLENVFLFTGEDDYSLERELSFWRKNFIEKHGDLNLTVLDGTKSSFNEIWGAVTTMPFLGEKRLVIVRGLPIDTSTKSSEELQNKEERLLEKLEQVPSESILVFVSPAPDKRRKFAKNLLKTAQVKDYPRLKGAQINEWTRKEFARRGVKISNAVLSRLTEMVGADLWQMSQEIDKLIKFADGEEIELMDLEMLVRAQLQDNVFKLTDAMGNRDAQKMLAILENLFSGGESPQQILYMLVRQVRLLSVGKSIIDENKTAQAAQILKVAPFVVRPLLAQSERFSWKELKNMYDTLLAIDEGLKTSKIETSAEDTRALELALEKFLLSIAAK